MRPRLLATAVIGLLVGGCVLASGCSQNTETPGVQNTDQDADANTKTIQDSMTLAPQTYIYVINAPGKSQVPSPGGDGETLDALLGNLTTADGTEVATSKAGYAQAGITINLTIGDTTPGQTGTTTGTGSATQNPTMAQTASPTQDVPARVGITAQLGVAPGGINDMQGTGSAGEGDTSSDKTSTNDLRWAKIETAVDKIAQAMDFVSKLMQGQQATTQPAS